MPAPDAPTAAEAITQVIDAAAEADMQRIRNLQKELNDIIDRATELTTHLEQCAKSLNNTIKRGEAMLYRRPTQPPISYQRK